jgi:hypothetical protein
VGLRGGRVRYEFHTRPDGEAAILSYDENWNLESRIRINAGGQIFPREDAPARWPVDRPRTALPSGGTTRPL